MGHNNKNKTKQKQLNVTADLLTILTREMSDFITVRFLVTLQMVTTRQDGVTLGAIEPSLL